MSSRDPSAAVTAPCVAATVPCVAAKVPRVADTIPQRMRLLASSGGQNESIGCCHPGPYAISYLNLEPVDRVLQMRIDAFQFNDLAFQRFLLSLTVHVGKIDPRAGKDASNPLNCRHVFRYRAKQKPLRETPGLRPMRSKGCCSPTRT